MILIGQFFGVGSPGLLRRAINLQKILQNGKKWFINVSKELDKKNVTLDTGTSLKHFDLMLLCSLSF